MDWPDFLSDRRGVILAVFFVVCITASIFSSWATALAFFGVLVAGVIIFLIIRSSEKDEL